MDIYRLQTTVSLKHMQGNVPKNTCSVGTCKQLNSKPFNTKSPAKIKNEKQNVIKRKAGCQLLKNFHTNEGRFENLTNLRRSQLREESWHTKTKKKTGSAITRQRLKTYLDYLILHFSYRYNGNEAKIDF